MNLELKLNAVLKRSEALVKQKLIAEALEASEQLDRGDARATARALVRGLVLVTGVGEDDFVLGHVFEVMAVFELPPKGPQGSKRCNNCRDGPDLATLAVQAEWDALLPRMIEVLEKDSGESDTSMDESSVDLASMISAMSPSPEPWFCFRSPRSAELTLLRRRPHR
ncbi:unnamed protein product [Polarella glacialis]|uniref:Uncharacterized protein n=1 Tax=Polarella glacialis TaxID=89957 RepID=A0A813ESD3_POLGL|nr:unnamed protein product [Polarella glacialis]